ncbi:MAG TPA: hypothetical protein VMV03_07305 [Spirochaetia bacterium]|nr:hypothetical protein [Spirochaetia bacterium]
MKRFAASCAIFLALAQLLFSQGTPCSDPMAVVRSFYDATDSLHFTEGLKYFTDDATFDTWATGVNGYIMAKRHLTGKKQIGAYLKNARGLRHRLPDSPPDGPIYHETRLSVSGSTVQFMLEPDRKRPNGRLYNPFSIEVIFDACRIKSLTVIERVTWL